MKQKTGSQGGVALDADVANVNGTITRREALETIQQKLAVTDRQARAAVSSYQAEGWPIPRGRINDPYSVQSSLDNRLALHVDRRHDARLENLGKVAKS